MTYESIPTVVVTLVPVNAGLLMVRRALEDGYGKLALPGGYQVKGETWQGAAVREVFEETGVELDRKNIGLLDIKTVETGINLIFCAYTLPLTVDEFRPDHETLEALVVYEPVECAFPTHTLAVKQFFRAPGFRFQI